uniref:Uncharacterized protein n=1 Tax=Timema shepardi TaxID=629360 RepID=A0A7R9FVT8_TIMSH|nr:unnamed protein product [Timema shepardi]
MACGTKQVKSHQDSQKKLHYSSSGEEENMDDKENSENENKKPRSLSWQENTILKETFIDKYKSENGKYFPNGVVNDL